MGKAHSLEDREYLSTLTTKHLRKLLDNTQRSIGELCAYVTAITAVLEEREHDTLRQ